jgi:hypothetical protein
MVMTNEEYKLFRAWGGMPPLIWCERLGIARDTDKSYSSGRLKVSDKVAELVHRYATRKYQKAQTLQQILQAELPEFNFVIDEANLNIDAFTTEGNRKVTFINCGMDNYFNELYHFGVKGKVPNVLIHDEESRNKNWYLMQRTGLKPGQAHLKIGYPVNVKITRNSLLAYQGIWN